MDGQRDQADCSKTAETDRRCRCDRIRLREDTSGYGEGLKDGMLERIADLVSTNIILVEPFHITRVHVCTVSGR